MNSTKLLFDADVLSYRLAFSAKDLTDPEDVTSLIVNLVNDIVNWLDPFGLIPKKYHKFYLTGSDNYRFEIAKSYPYKGNRKSEKPEWLSYIRSYFVSAYGAVVAEGEEADDMIAKECAKNNYKGVVVISTDKDFKQLPVTIFNPTRFDLTHVTEWEATKYFYQQILTGDTVDNIKGIYGIGPAKAVKLLESCDSEKALYNSVVSAYCQDIHGQFNSADWSEKNINLVKERILENGRLLWLRRYDNQLWEPPNV